MAIVHEPMDTRVDEIAPGIHRISTPVPEEVMPGGFSFNQFLLVDAQPLLFHTGPRKLFAATLAAVRSIVDPKSLRWIGFSHVEADECGALNEWLGVAPDSQPLCSRIAALVSVNDLAMRPARGLSDGEALSLGSKCVRWIDTPHLPHGMETGYLFETSTRTLLCGDLFTQPGSDTPAVTESEEEVWGPSEAFRQGFAYAPIRNASALIDKLADTQPALLACMHGASYRGQGAELLRKLGRALAQD